jgi:hypothetical protein
MAAVNTVIRFAENTHKYGPVAVRKAAPLTPFVIASLLMIGIPLLLVHIVPPDLFLLDQMVIVLDPG